MIMKALYLRVVIHKLNCDYTCVRHDADVVLGKISGLARLYKK